MKDGLTLSESLDLKTILENNIFTLLTEYTEKTGLSFNEIKLNKVMIVNGDILLTNVHIVVEF